MNFVEQEKVGAKPIYFFLGFLAAGFSAFSAATFFAFGAAAAFFLAFGLSS